MARPKTMAANYKMVTFRLPPDLLSEVRIRCDVSGAPLNTELIRLVRKALHDEKSPKSARRAPAAPVGG